MPKRVFWTALAFLGISLVNGLVDFHREFANNPFHQELENPEARLGDEGLIEFLRNLFCERKREAMSSESVSSFCSKSGLFSPNFFRMTQA